MGDLGGSRSDPWMIHCVLHEAQMVFLLSSGVWRLFLLACSTSRNTRTPKLRNIPEHPKNPEHHLKPGAPPRKPGTPPENQEHSPENLEHPPKNQEHLPKYQEKCKISKTRSRKYFSKKVFAAWYSYEIISTKKCMFRVQNFNVKLSDVSGITHFYFQAPATQAIHQCIKMSASKNNAKACA